MIGKYLFSTAFCLVVFQGKGQLSDQSLLRERGFDTERIERIDKVIQDAIINDEIPGAVVLVARNGKIAYYKSFGFAELATKKAMERNSVFRIASMSKALTSVGVMILYERGHFLLSDPISKFIPEFKNPKILVEADSLGNVIKTEPSKKEIRIIDLLTHQSGISYPFLPTDLKMVYKQNGIIDAVTVRNVVLKDQMEKLSELPLLFEPGSKIQYGLSIDLLGYLCEVISGKPLNQFLDDELFTPLKMEDTQFYLPPNKSDRLVTLYSWTPDKGLTISKGSESPIYLDNPNFPVEGAKTYYSGGGGMSSTVYDYWRFTQMLLNNGVMDGTRIISRKSVELMSKARIDWNRDGELDFGLGFYIETNIAKAGELGSNGAFSGAGAFYGLYWIDPVENLTAVFMSQVLPSRTDVALKFRTMVYQALE